MLDLQDTYCPCFAVCALKEARGGKDLNLIVSDYESKNFNQCFAVRLLSWELFSETSQNRTIAANFLGTVWMVKSTLTPGAAGRNRTYDGGLPFWNCCSCAIQHTLFIAAVLPLDHCCIERQERDSNPRPTHYECVALPTEPRKLVENWLNYFTILLQKKQQKISDLPKLHE